MEPIQVGECTIAFDPLERASSGSLEKTTGWQGNPSNFPLMERFYGCSFEESRIRVGLLCFACARFHKPSPHQHALPCHQLGPKIWILLELETWNLLLLSFFFLFAFTQIKDRRYFSYFISSWPTLILYSKLWGGFLIILLHLKIN